MSFAEFKKEGERMKKSGKRILQTITAVAMAAVLAFGSGNYNMRVYAYDTKAASISCSSDSTVNLRQKATTSSQSLGKLKNGTPLTVTGQEEGADGTWYQVEYVNASGKKITGYVRGDLLQISGDTASGTTSGTINGIYVAVRNAAGTRGTQVLCHVDTGQALQILGQTTVNGATWYNVSLSAGGQNYTGWVYGEYVKISQTVTDADYVTQLVNAGFPASYTTALTQLHQKYPNWTFEAVQTGLDWNTAVSNESILGRNLVHNSYDDSRKSTEGGAYNWNTNSWTALDGTTWVAANSSYIAYCMDPRNFLNETYIFMFEDLSYNATQNISGVKSVIGNTFMANDVRDSDGSTLNYAQTFMDIGRQLGISPYHLASRVRQEQGSGTSSLISGNYKGYEGYYNYFNVGAYTTSSGSITQNGLAYAKRQGWNSRYKSIYGGAQLLGKSYISKGQDTIYFEKFNVVNKSALYSHQYMTNVMAPMSEAKTQAAGYSDKTQAFNFRIPVYQNMPDGAVTFADTGNPNNYLKSLSVSGLSLTPGFNGNTTNYSIVAGAGVGSVTISAAAVAGSSKVSGTGTFALNTGNNVFQINCTSESGQTRTYTISIARESSGGNNSGNNGSNPNGNSSSDYSVTSSTYKIGTYVTGIQPKTASSTVLGGIQASGCTAKILKADGSENTGNVGTGNKLAVYVNGTLTKTYDIVIYGDVNGDGSVSIADFARLNRYLLHIVNLNGAYLEAADANRDGKVSIADFARIDRTLLGRATITQ